jgi:hypothetical protein
VEEKEQEEEQEKEEEDEAKCEMNTKFWSENKGRGQLGSLSVGEKELKLFQKNNRKTIERDI